MKPSRDPVDIYVQHSLRQKSEPSHQKVVLLPIGLVAQALFLLHLDEPANSREG